MRKKFLRKYGIVLNKKILGSIVLIILATAIFFFIPPQNIFIIFTFISLITASGYLFSSAFTSKKVAFILSLSLFLLLIFKSLAILDLMNLSILVSFLVALSIFLYQK